MTFEQTKKSHAHLAAMFFISSFVCSLFFWISLYHFIRTAGWVKIEAVITMYDKYESGLILDADGNHVNYSYDYSYQYKYDGGDYSFTRNKQDDYPRRRSNKITCFVNPLNPTEHVLSRTIGLISYFALAGSIGLALYGLYQIKQYQNIKRRIQRLNLSSLVEE